MATAWLSLGSNLEPERHLAAAAAALRRRFADVRFSPVYRSDAVGFDGPPFLNAAAVLESDLPALALDAWLHALEDTLGRRRDVPRFSSRTLDVDLLLYGDEVLRGPGHLELPRPELATEAFVLVPMVDLAPTLVHPTLQCTLATLLAQRDTPHGLQRTGLQL